MFADCKHRRAVIRAARNGVFQMGNGKIRRPGTGPINQLTSFQCSAVLSSASVIMKSSAIVNNFPTRPRMVGPRPLVHERSEARTSASDVGSSRIVARRMTGTFQRPALRAGEKLPARVGLLTRPLRRLDFLRVKIQP